MKTKNTNTKLLLLLSMALLTMLIIPALVSADISAVSITAPSSSTNHSGTVTVSISWTGNNTDGGNATIYYNTAGAPVINSAKIFCTVTSNLSQQSSTGSCNKATSSLTADSDYRLIAVVYNTTSSNFANSSVISSLMIDNTAPTYTLTALQKSYLQTRDKLTLECIASDNLISAPSTTINITKPNGDVVTGSVDNTGSGGVNTTFSKSDFSQPGTYTIDCGGVDGSLNSGTATDLSLTVRNSGSDENFVVTQQSTTLGNAFKGRNTLALLGLLFFVSMGGILLLLFNSGKKR